MKAKQAGHSRFLHVLPLACAGALLAMLAAPHSALAAVESNPARGSVHVPSSTPCSVHGVKRAAYRPDSMHGRAHLRIELDPRCKRVVLERVWGTGPDGLQHVWDRVVHPIEGHLFLYPDRHWNRRDRPFTVGFRVRAVLADGSLAAPSTPYFMTHSASAEVDRGARSDHVLLAFLILGVVGLWRLYRREPSMAFRIRLAAASALASLMFLSVTPAMPWIATGSDPIMDRPAVECQLGEESACATYLPDGNPDPLTVGEASLQRNFELSRWICASSAVRIGLVLSLIVLLPGLIWLLVAPRLRAAQAAVAFGASMAAFTFLSVLFYRLAIPSWMSGATFLTFDMALVSAANIVVAAFLIAKCALTDGPVRTVLPCARVRAQG